MTTKLTAEQVADRLFVSAGIALANGKDNEATGMLSAMQLIRDNLIETPDERRERFEAWCRQEYPESRIGNSFLRDDGCYAMGWIESLWRCWNASQDFRRGDA